MASHPPLCLVARMAGGSPASFAPVVERGFDTFFRRGVWEIMRRSWKVDGAIGSPRPGDCTRAGTYRAGSSSGRAPRLESPMTDRSELAQISQLRWCDAL